MRARVRSSTCCMPRVLVAECVERVSGTIRSCWPARETAQVRCVSARMGMDGPVQTGEANSELNGPLVVISRTAPVSQDVAYGARSAFSERPSRTRLRAGILVRERPAYRKRPSRGRLKCRRGLMEFGKRGFPCAHVCKAPRAAYHAFCSRNVQSGFPGRCACASLHGKPRRLGVRVTSPRISQHECRGKSARSPTWGIPRKRALIGMCRVTSWRHVSASGGTSVSPIRTNGRAVNCHHGAAEKKKRALLQVYGPAGCGGYPVIRAKEALVSGMGSFSSTGYMGT